MKVTGHIYCLKDPTDNDRIFYVGQTVMKLNERAVNHVTESRFRMTAKGLVITKIIEAGFRPIIESLEQFDADSYSDIDALMNEREIYWIQQFKGLCNKNYAGLDLICDNCANPFKAKRSRAKFCSDVCRASFHQKKAKKQQEVKKDVGLTELQQMKVLYNALMEKIDNLGLPKIEYINPRSPQENAALLNTENKNQFTRVWEEPIKPKITLKRTPVQWVELRRECETAEDYAKWLEDLENSDLSTRDKNLIKQTI